MRVREDTVSTDPLGRVDDDGTVYVRTARGRAVPSGSWQAGEPEEALAYFHRKFDELAGQVQLLEQRVKGTDLAPAQAEATIVKSARGRGRRARRRRPGRAGSAARRADRAGRQAP
ncbi:hypothetical protein GCM10020219_017890 [Nonomuraea dietziae]